MKIINKLLLSILVLLFLIAGSKSNAQLITNKFEIISLSADSPLRSIDFDPGSVSHSFCYNPPIIGATHYDNNAGQFVLEVACGEGLGGYYLFAALASGGAAFTEGVYEHPVCYSDFDEPGPRMSISGPGVYGDVIDQRFEILYLHYAPDWVHIDGLSIMMEVTRASGEIEAFKADFNSPFEFAERSLLSMLAIPEPSSVTILCSGVLLLTSRIRRRR
ncbi:MAG: hypothetical protein AAB610_01165 [Patescibacteria group bacterium]